MCRISSSGRRAVNKIARWQMEYSSVKDRPTDTRQCDPPDRWHAAWDTGVVAARGRRRDARRAGRAIGQPVDACVLARVGVIGVRLVGAAADPSTPGLVRTDAEKGGSIRAAAGAAGLGPSRTYNSVDSDLDLIV
jgi:hypothetical protein